jgi:hypothetical protein
MQLSYPGTPVKSVAGKTGVVTLVKGDVGLGNVDNTSDADKNSATVTLTNKTISGSSNTLANIGNSSLTNSAITFGATSQALGSTVSALNAVSIGGTTAGTGAFTTLSASSTVSGTGFSNYLASPPAIGGSSPAAGAFTNLSYTGTLTGGTGVINIGSGQIVKDTSGNVGIGANSPSNYITGGGLAISQSSAGAETIPFALINPNNSASTQVSLAFTPNVNIPLAKISAIRTNASGTTDLAFYTYGGSPIQMREYIRIASSGNVGIGASVNNVFDGAAAARPLLVQSASSATVVSTSTNALVICNSDTTANNLSQINFAAITGASTNQYSSALISVIHGARVNGQYPTGQMVFSTASATNSAPTEKVRIANTGVVTVGNPSAPAISLNPTTANALVVNSSGNVGIGTSSISAKLQVNVSAAAKALILTDTVASDCIFIPGVSSGVFRIGPDNGALALYAGTSIGVERARITVAGDVLVTGGGGLGYGTGSGGAVTQATNKSTAVTLNKTTGQITMNNAALAGGATVAFQVNNSLVATSDNVIVTVGGFSNYSLSVYIGSAGNFTCKVTNTSGGSLSEALIINFAVIKGATS